MCSSGKYNIPTTFKKLSHINANQLIYAYNSEIIGDYLGRLQQNGGKESVYGCCSNHVRRLGSIEHCNRVV